MNNQIEILKQQIQEKENLISDKEKEIDNFDRSEHASETDYDEMLDSDGPVDVCGMSFYPSRILEELDEIAYRCGFNDYADNLDNESFPEYVELQEELESLQDELSDLEQELEEAEE